MRRLSLSLVVVASVAAALSSPQLAAADTIPYEKIPVRPAKPEASEDKPPPPQIDKIAATEKVDGIYPAILPEARRKYAEDQGYRYVQVFTNAKDASDYAADGNFNSSLDAPSNPRQCLSTGNGLSNRLNFYLRTKPYPTPPQNPFGRNRRPGSRMMKPRPAPPPPPKGPPKPEPDTLRNIHGEKLIIDGDTATIETSESMIDLNTMGVRQISRTSMKLAKVTSGPGGMGIFASRSDKGLIQFLVTHPDLPKSPVEEAKQDFIERFRSTAEDLTAEPPSGQDSDSGCGYVSFNMAAKQGAGQMATVLATAFLQPAPDPDDAPVEPVEKTDKDAKSDDDEHESEDEERKAKLRTQRTRRFAINFSVSQLENRDTPTLSVSFGWAGKSDSSSF
jgi:hypothetical protein